jgi:hypothetical protein
MGGGQAVASLGAVGCRVGGGGVKRWRRRGGGQAAMGWKGGGGEVEGQAAACGGQAAARWKAAVSLGALGWKGGGELGGGVLGGDDGGEAQWRCWRRRAQEPLRWIGYLFAFRCWRSYGMDITVVVCKCFIGSSIWVLLLEIVLYTAAPATNPNSTQLINRLGLCFIP